MIEVFTQLLKDKDVPTWAVITAVLTAIAVYGADVLAGAAAKFVGGTYQRQAHIVADLEARLLSVQADVKRERERAEIEIECRSRVEARLHETIAELDRLNAAFARMKVEQVRAASGEPIAGSEKA